MKNAAYLLKRFAEDRRVKKCIWRGYAIVATLIFVSRYYRGSLLQNWPTKYGGVKAERKNWWGVAAVLYTDYWAYASTSV